MKWITLKIYMLPIIMQEVDSVIEKYVNLINELRRTNDPTTQSEFDELRDSITSRIHQIEKFYEDNIHDLRITNFEKVRLRLKKLLMYDVDTLNKIENTAEFTKNSTAGYNNSNADSNIINDNQKSVNNINNLNNNKNENKSIKNQTPIQNQSPIQNNSNGFNSVSNMNNNSKVSKKGSSKFNMNYKDPAVYTLDYEFKSTGIKKSTSKIGNSPTNQNNRNQQLIQNVDLFGNTGINNSNSNDFKDFNQWREIVFKIKLTEKEYELLLKQKSKGFNF